MPRVLISVSDKTGLIPFARALYGRGYELLSTGGTARALVEAELPVTSVSNVTGFPEMLDGRVKTLHPAIHGGILARRAHPEDLAALDRLRIALIDIVVVNLYPFARAAGNPAIPFDGLVEEIDIGGPSLLRAAAKNFRDVLVVVEPTDYERVLQALEEHPVAPAFRFDLAKKAFAHTAAYDAMIASTFGTVEVEGERFTRRTEASAGPAGEAAGAEPTVGVSSGSGGGLARAVAVGGGTGSNPEAAGSSVTVGTAPAPTPQTLARAPSPTPTPQSTPGTPADAAGSDLPEHMNVALQRLRVLRYGENPHQQAGWYAEQPPRGFGAVRILQGKELSYTNLLDLDAAARIVLEFSEPAAAVIKHTNPCGVATGDSIVAAYVAARDADALSAFGGIIGLNRPLDNETAQAIATTFIEAVIAPAVHGEALTILAKKPSLRVLTADLSAFGPSGAGSLEVRSILGAMLVQQRDRVIEAHDPWDLSRAALGKDSSSDLRIVSKRHPTPEEWQALRFAWRVCAHVKSNTIVFTGRDRTRAIGAGQMSRVDAVKVAVMKAGGQLAGSVVASDAFFPFRDSIDVLAAAGATAVVQPGGSVRDADVIAAADEFNLAMVFTGRRHFRH
jgi:phosphoribosylaminoimidazolecarboxamide formyltransferase/IMP cyclohydrolase